MQGASRIIFPTHLDKDGHCLREEKEYSAIILDIFQNWSCFAHEHRATASGSICLVLGALRKLPNKDSSFICLLSNEPIKSSFRSTVNVICWLVGLLAGGKLKTVSAILDLISNQSKIFLRKLSFYSAPLRLTKKGRCFDQKRMPVARSTRRCIIFTVHADHKSFAFHTKRGQLLLHVLEDWN